MTARDALNCSTSRRSWDGEEQGLVLCELWVTSAREVPCLPPQAYKSLCHNIITFR